MTSSWWTAGTWGGAWVLDRVWERLGIATAIGKIAAGRKLEATAVERVLVAQRALAPGSKLAGTRWVAERVAIEGLPGLSDDQACRAMDFLLEALEQIAGEIFGRSRTCSTSILTWSSSTPHRRTSSSTCPMSSPTCRTR